MKKFISILFICFSVSMTSFAGDLVLWYQQPMAKGHFMDEALPIGNGRSGGLISGGVAQEDIVLNEDSLWSGDANTSGDYGTMGTYQMLGHLIINLQGQEQAANYRRDLDIGDALAHVTYKVNGVAFQREYFSSYPGNVMVIRLTAGEPGKYSGNIELNDSRDTITSAGGNRLRIAGTLINGLKYEAQLLAINDGGTVQASGSMLEFKDCNSLTLIVAMGTDYVMDYMKHYHGDDPQARVTALVDAAARQDYAALKAAHEQDFHKLFDRVAFNVGESTAEQSSMPTDQRKIKAAEAFDPGMEQLLFQYGRYLLISCSRPGGLPANLQGLWTDANNPPWDADYHTDLNIEMNYWAAEPANLSECDLPLFDLILSQIPAWRYVTAGSAEFRTSSGQFTQRGWAVRVSHNINGGMGWLWDKTANAWYCHQFWEHYAFTGDKQFLKDVAYPVMDETCEFWEDHLKTLPDGRLVVPNGWSPEHGPMEDGVSYNQELVWDLFNNHVQASEALGGDQKLEAKIADMRDKLAAPGIGSWGQLLEWMNEKTGTNAVPGSPELDTPNDHHRHTSHLVALYPGHQISPDRTPALAAAAKVSLDARGTAAISDVREWSFVWRTALYARLHDGEQAYGMIQNLFSARNTCPNLFGLLPPMQVDGSLAVTAAICEMLVQSQEGEINLLPALPGEWPTGSVRGLCARGDFTVDLEWKDGRLKSATIHSWAGGDCRVRYGEIAKDLIIRKNQSVTLDGNLMRIN
jgi:alpha-L-fucosidase 2